MNLFRKNRAPSSRLYGRRHKLATARRRSTLRSSTQAVLGNTRNIAIARPKTKLRAGAHYSRPRPVGKHWQSKPWLVKYDDGREICNLSKSAGLGEYRLRIFLMWVRQDGWCCNCGYRLKLSEATFEHEDGRTKARRDDRIAIFNEDGHFVRHLNGASHPHCNCKRGSRRTEIFHGDNCYIEKEGA